MEEKEFYPDVLAKISKDFSTSKTSIEVVEEYSKDIESLRAHLTKKITEMMEKDFDRFLNNLYRIDVSEEKVTKVLSTAPFELVPSMLADLIIERQIQRINTQRLYKEGKL